MDGFYFRPTFFAGLLLFATVCKTKKSRKENLISELHTRKGTWKIVVRITDLWQARKQNSKQIIEMGSKIAATLWQELFTELRDKLQCGSSYLIQNLRIVDNQSEYRVSPAPYLVYFLKTTSVKEIHRPEIPSNIYLITPFTDIISGLAPCHTLYPPHRMTVRLKDNSNCDILITVWEDYAIQLHDAIDKNLLLQEPLVVMLTLGKIKDATEIHEFPQSLSVPFYSGGIINDKDGSQSQSSQSNVVENFLQIAQVVSIVDEIIINAPWSYDSCPNCTTTFDPSKGGSSCRSCHTSVIDTVPRYKLNVRMEHNGDKVNFLLWDATCIKLFGKTAGECRDELIADGDDIKVFPTCVDEILSKTWAVRFKFCSQLRQSSVLDVSEELHHIQSLIPTLGLSKGKGIAVEPESSPPIFVPTQTSSDFDSDEHAQYQLSTNKHIKVDQLLQKSNYSWTYMLNEGSVGKLFYKNEKDNVQLLMCISQCSPTISHNNNPATSFQSTPPSHGTLSINDSERCSKRHAVNVSCIQRNLMSSFEHQKNRTTAFTSTCQGSNPYFNMTQSDIHRDKHGRATNTTQHNQFVAHDSSHSTDNDLLQKSNYSWTNMLNEGSVGKVFYKNGKNNVQLLVSNSQCSATINDNNNPATSFQYTPPSHGTLYMNDSRHCSKRHTINRNLMSSYDNQNNITTASTSTCQASNTYSNMTQLDIHRDEHQTPTTTTQHDQFVGNDSSDSTDDDVNMTQENIDIGIYPSFIIFYIMFLR
ncbi:hypothetical protein HKD37_10G028525 [Glycine soja]